MQASDDYPANVNGVWVRSPFAHLKLYVERAERDKETHVAVPAWLLRRVAQFRACEAKNIFLHDEDGPLPRPFEAVCRKEIGHDALGKPNHVRQHTNGYYVWDADSKDTV